jgi:hypothetical protein
MKRTGIRHLFWASVGVIVLFGLAASAGKSTPPGASFVYGQMHVPEGFGGSFTVSRWKEGLTILLIDDIAAGHESSGSGSTEGPIWWGMGGAVAEDGRDVSWRAETTDGKTTSFFINRQAYDLTQGTLFLIRTTDGRTSVIQQTRVLAGIVRTRMTANSGSRAIQPSHNSSKRPSGLNWHRSSRPPGRSTLAAVTCKADPNRYRCYDSPRSLLRMAWLITGSLS